MNWIEDAPRPVVPEAERYWYLVGGKCDLVPPVMRKTRPDWSGMSVLGFKKAFDILSVVI